MSDSDIAARLDALTRTVGMQSALIAQLVETVKGQQKVIDTILEHLGGPPVPPSKPRLTSIGGGKK